jgi:hypothetical protein
MREEPQEKVDSPSNWPYIIGEVKKWLGAKSS